MAGGSFWRALAIWRPDPAAGAHDPTDLLLRGWDADNGLSSIEHFRLSCLERHILPHITQSSALTLSLDQCFIPAAESHLNPHLRRLGKPVPTNRASQSQPPPGHLPTEWEKTTQETDTPIKDSIPQSFPISTATPTPTPPSTSHLQHLPTRIAPSPVPTRAPKKTIHSPETSTHQPGISKSTTHVDAPSLPCPIFRSPGHRQSEFRHVYDGDHRGLSPQKIGLTARLRISRCRRRNCRLVSIKRIRTCMQWPLSIHSLSLNLFRLLTPAMQIPWVVALWGTSQNYGMMCCCRQE